jgi:hypothetical protein
MRASPEYLDTLTLDSPGLPALNGPSPDMDQQGPQEANVPRASGSDLTSLRRPRTYMPAITGVLVLGEQR